MKVAFVTPWFGEKIPGGAEMATRGLITNMVKREIEVEVLTTCVKEFNSEWKDYYISGEYKELGVVVRRFNTDKRDVKAFDSINSKIINGYRLKREEEEIFLKEMINSTSLYSFIKEHYNDYDAFLFIPYMFGTTYFGAKECLKKAIVIPCFHRENYLNISMYKDVFENVKAIMYNAEPEKIIANDYFDLKSVKQVVAGLGLDTDISSNAERFIEKTGIKNQFIIYAGRKDIGKNVDVLIKYFTEYKKRNTNELKLILIGGGEIEIPKKSKKDIIDLGFLSIQEKYDAMAASLCLCQPSKNESFSLVIMESWLCNRPVLVNSKCEVTKNFVKESNGGFYFDNYFEFEEEVNYYISNIMKAKTIAQQGKDYVLDNFTWNKIIDKYIELIYNNDK